MTTGEDDAQTLKFFVAGAAHVDRRGRSVEPFRLRASNPGTMIETTGGAIFNAARVIRALGGEVLLVSARGGDQNAAFIRDALDELDIGEIAMTWLDRRTPTYTALLDEGGELVAGFADMALYDLLRSRVFARRHIREALASSDAVMLDANLPAQTIETLVEAAGARPITAIGVSPAKATRLAKALPKLTAVFLSRAEAAALAMAEVATPVSVVIEHLVEAGCRRAVITDGGGHVVIVDGNETLRQAPLALSGLRDVTGAGDTLAGVASHAFASGINFPEAVRLGMAAASLHVSSSRSPGSPTKNEIRDAAARMPPCETCQPENLPDVS